MAEIVLEIFLEILEFFAELWFDKSTKRSKSSDKKEKKKLKRMPISGRKQEEEIKA